jgi:N-acetylneuraminate epimerase
MRMKSKLGELALQHGLFARFFDIRVQENSSACWARSQGRLMMLGRLVVVLCWLHTSLLFADQLNSGPIKGWIELPSLPDKEGFAGPYAGAHRDRLIVAGGANFPDKMPWEGGSKVWYDNVFMLDSPQGNWQVVGQLPRPLGYGVSISTNEGIVCIGGSDASRHYKDCFRLQWMEGKLTAIDLPTLPRPCANASGAIFDRTIYVAGGLESPTALSPLKTFWCLDLSDPNAVWQEIEPWPGPPRMLATAAVLDGWFYLCSGTDLKPNAEGKVERHYLRDAYRFRPSDGWERISDMPRAAVAAPSPSTVVSPSTFVILGGDDGTHVGFQPPENHPGFSKSILEYDTSLHRWQTVGETPASHVTTTIVSWRGRYVIPSGEVRPGKRSPTVWSFEQMR